MPLTKELKRRDGTIYVNELSTGKLLIAVSESFGLDNSAVMKLLRSITANKPGPSGQKE